LLGEANRARRKARYDLPVHLAMSSHPSPVSVVVWALDDQAAIVETVRALLSQTYPRFEVIVVNDGSTDATLDSLIQAFDLKSQHTPVRRWYRSRRVREVYTSAAVPALRVIDKDSGGQGDGFNCGLNFARYAYVCLMDGHTTLSPDALTEAMRPMAADADEPAGVTTSVILGGAATGGHRPAGGRPRVNAVLAAFQYLYSTRAFVTDRIAQRRFGLMPCPVGRVAIWRADVLRQVNGFSAGSVRPDLDIALRVHQHFAKLRKPCRVASLPLAIARTRPTSIGVFVRRRSRWHRAMRDAARQHRYVIAGGEAGGAALGRLRLSLFSPVAGVLAYGGAIVSVATSCAVGLLNPLQGALLLLSVATAGAVLTNLTVLIGGGAENVPTSLALAGLTLLGPIEVFVFRPVLLYAQGLGALSVSGVSDFIRPATGRGRR
jgi:cellulose synthase/poly-beta-1,6-N-acetylglucosamine synthase-like glycosyltransferase